MSETFKIVLVGDAEVGKTSFVKKHKLGLFEQKYLATIGMESSILKFNQHMNFNIWDTAGQQKYKGLYDGYYIGALGVIIMASADSASSIKNATKHILNVKRVVKAQTPITLTINKNDVEKCENYTTLIKSFKKQNPKIKVFEISTKTGYNFEKPFSFLASKLIKSKITGVPENEVINPLGVKDDESYDQNESTNPPNIYNGSYDQNEEVTIQDDELCELLENFSLTSKTNKESTLPNKNISKLEMELLSVPAKF